jgi:hypothetical protein
MAPTLEPPDLSETLRKLIQRQLQVKEILIFRPSIVFSSKPGYTI